MDSRLARSVGSVEGEVTGTYHVVLADKLAV